MTDTPADIYMELRSLHERQEILAHALEVAAEVAADVSEENEKLRAERDTLRAAVEAICERDDYCIVCDNHPSHGHAKDCPVSPEREA